jgi:hypothetical protein
VSQRMADCKRQRGRKGGREGGRNDPDTGEKREGALGFWEDQLAGLTAAWRGSVRGEL